jgi:23S rRNA pseudouridine2605 synthase
MTENKMPELTDKKSGERIAKVMARAGLASRREAEAWIAAGRVSVNGAVIASPALNVTPRDVIAVDGTPLRARERTRLFVHHKVPGLVTTHHDPQGRPTIFGSLPKNLPRVISVGRLDINTEGLLLLTNDGDLARALELPSTAWLRRYRVRAYGRVTRERLNALRKGTTIEGVHYGPIEATLEREQGSNVWLSFAIREGKNREVRNVLRSLDLQVNRLIRVSFGPFELGELPDGEVEEIESADLKKLLGPEVIAAAKPDFDGPVIDHSIVIPTKDDLETIERRRDERRKQNKKERFSTTTRNDPKVKQFRRHRKETSEQLDAEKKPASQSLRKPPRNRRDRSRGGPRPSRPR